jgi:putative ABC transport system permease protein
MIMVVTVNVFTVGLSVLVVKTIDPLFNQLFDLSGADIWYHSTLFWPLVASLVLTGALVMGIYPSLVNTRVETAHVASRSHTMPNRNFDFRKILVVVQFALSAILIFNALLLTRQVNYMLSRDLGFNPEEVVLLNSPETWCQTPDSVKSGYIDHLRNLLIPYPEIEFVSGCRFAPGSESWVQLDNLTLLNSKKSREHLTILANLIDHSYFDVLEVETLAGRSFHTENRMDRGCLIINAAAMRELGISDPESAINLKLTNGNTEFRIVGVVRDHHHLGLRNAIRPMAYMHRYAYDFGFLLIKTRGDSRKAIGLVQKHWEEEYPVALFDYHFLDDFYNAQYKPEFRLKRSIAFFSLIAMVLACAGLFGLLKYSLNNRIKEISIKRVLGAGIFGLMVRLSAEFLALVLISMVIAFSLSWWIAGQWLQNFTFRIPVSPWVFVLSVLVILAASTFTMVWHIYRSASQNPVAGLRDE